MTPDELRKKYRNVDIRHYDYPLDQLDLIDWSSLSHAHGDASDIPALLRAAVSRNEHDRKFAFMLLFETIWHQGTVYEASAYVVPFLFKLLSSPPTPDKASIVALLASLADGHSYLEAHAFYDKENEISWRNILAKEDKTLEEELKKERLWVAAGKTAVGKGLPLLYPYLEDESASIRQHVAKTLGFYRDYIDETLPLLEQAYLVEDDKYAKKEMESAIANLKRLKQKIDPQNT